MRKNYKNWQNCLHLVAYPRKPNEKFKNCSFFDEIFLCLLTELNFPSLSKSMFNHRYLSAKISQIKLVLYFQQITISRTKSFNELFIGPNKILGIIVALSVSISNSKQIYHQKNKTNKRTLSEFYLKSDSDMHSTRNFK